MNTYVNWLLIGFIVGIGLYAGELASDYAYRQYLQKKESAYLRVDEAAEITIEQERMVLNKLSHNVVGYILNKADYDYHAVTLSFLIHDEKGLRHICKERITRLEPGRTPFETSCVFIEEPLDLRVHELRIDEAYREK